jgi:hypothetical protein
MDAVPRVACFGSSVELTLGDVIAAVSEVAEDEREVVAVVLYMLATGRLRLRRCACAIFA